MWRVSIRFHSLGLKIHATENLDRTHEYLTSGAPLIPSGENECALALSLQGSDY